MCLALYRNCVGGVSVVFCFYFLFRFFCVFLFFLCCFGLCRGPYTISIYRELEGSGFSAIPFRVVCPKLVVQLNPATSEHPTLQTLSL